MRACRGVVEVPAIGGTGFEVKPGEVLFRAIQLHRRLGGGIVAARRVTPREERPCLLRSPPARVENLRGVDGVSGFDQMAGHLERPGILTIRLGERVRDREAVPLPSAGFRCDPELMRVERMREPRTVGVASDDAEALARGQRPLDGISRANLPQVVEGHLVTEDRGHGQDVALVVRQAAERRGQRLTEIRRHREVPERRGQVPAGQQVVDHGLDEERVAAGGLVDGTGELAVGLGESEHADQLGGFGFGESPQLELERALLATEAGEIDLELRIERRAVRTEHHEGKLLAEGVVGAREHEVAQQLERRFVDPLEVVENQQERLLAGEPQHRLREHREQLHALVLLGRRVPCRG